MKHYYLIRVLCMAILFIGHQLSAQDKEDTPTIPTIEEALKRMANGEKFNMKKVFQHNDPNFSLSGKEDNPYLRLEFDFNRLKDPFTGKIPDNIRQQELKYIHSKKSKLQDNFNKNGQLRAIGDITSPWVNRGPYNVGGRTRGIAIDLTDEDIIIAGGVSGGLWRTTDQGLNWARVSELDDNPSITAVVQDPTNTGTWYYATGEWVGTSASARNGAATFRGNGIWKSINNGVTWNELSSTTTNSPQTYNNVFQYNMNMAISPATGHLYVANSGGIYESQNDGSSFSQVLAANPFTETDVVVDSNGVLYAAFDSGAGTNTGVYRSTDGTTWTSITPTGFPGSYSRITLGIAPSNEDVVWVFVEGTGNANGLDHDLWKFTYDAMDADGDGGTWEDRSSNLPALGGNVGDLNTQGGYDMFVKAHPTNEDIVFIGGTNLYRSTDGFATTVNTDWIGGYSPQNDVSLYSDHHPDLHNLLFFSSNSSMALSAHDGGISITSDILQNNGQTEEVDWTLLSNGYLTTQVYALSIGPGDQIMAGFQDNSTWFSNSTSSTATWVDQFSGDGAYNQINNDGTVRYVSAQRGVIARQTYSDANSSTPLSSTRINPTGASGALFVAPIEMDPNNDEILYFAAGSSVWRNTNAPNATSDSWSELSNAQASSGSVSSIGISTNPPNTIYFGTTSGGIYRVDNAIAGNPSGTDVFTGKGLPSGNVANVEVDPADRDHVFVTFSNYSIPSVFETTDGGSTWTDVSGNLEENTDGSGSGPSVRWIDMVGDNDIYFVGTSTGLYSTQTINGSSTTWTQVEPGSIGNAVVEQIRSRNDGLVVVGTHGNGLFSAEVEVANITPEITINQEVADQVVAENSGNVVIDISNVFTTTGNPFSVEIFDNSDASLVSTSLANDEITLSFTPASTGEALITLRAFEGNEEAYTYFLVTVGGDLFEGTYTMIQLSNSDLSSNVFGGNGTTFSADGVTIVDLVVVDEDTRSFSAVYFESFGIGQSAAVFQFDLNANGEVVFGSNQTTNLQAGSPLLLGTASTPGTYDESDPSNFTLTLAEDDGASFGGPYDVSFQLFVNQAPTAVAIDNTTIDEGLPSGTLVGNISAVDSNPNDSFTFLLGGTDAASFTLNGTALASAEVFDFVTKSSYDITITVTDATGAQFVQDLQISVNGGGPDCSNLAAPGNLAAVVIDNTTVELSWDDLGFEYIVDLSGDFNQEYTISTNTGVLGGLTPGTAYSFRVKSVCEEQESDYSDFAFFTTTGCESVTIPTNLDVSSITNTTATLTWDDDGQDYVVLYKEDVGSTLSSSVLTEATLTLSELLPGTRYLFKVQALCAGNATVSSDFTAWQSFVTTIDGCNVPTGFSVSSIDNTSATLSWVDEGNDYVVQYKDDSGPLIESSTLTEATLALSSLTPGTRYLYKVQSVCDLGGTIVEGDFSAWQSFTTTVAGCDAPSGFMVSPLDNTSATINWIDDGNDYIVLYKDDTGPTTQSSTLTEATLALSGLTPGTRYLYKVQSICDLGGTIVEGEFSAWQSFTTSVAGCDVPTGFSVSPLGNTTATLNWVDDGSDYIVLYKDDTGPTTQSSTLTEATLALSSLTPGTRYLYKVQAVCDLGGTIVEGDFSAWQSFTTTVTGCGVPTGFSVSPIDNTSATINWADDGNDYIVLYKDDTGPIVESSTLTEATLALSSLTPGTRYLYKVQAICDLGGTIVEGDFSAWQSFTTTVSGCDAPTGFSVSPLGETSATINWTDNGNDYIVLYKDDVGPIVQSSVLTDATLSLSGLTAGTRYLYKVRSVCDLGGTIVEGDFSAWQSFITTGGMSSRVADTSEELAESPGEEEPETLELITEIYPNPVRSGFVKMAFNQAVENLQLRLISIDGKVHHLNFESSESRIYTVQLDGLPNGIYVMEINSNGVKTHKRLIITR